MIKQHSAGIILVTYDRGTPLYLLLHYLGGYWDLPKGKLEEAETVLQAAHRELAEETGLKAQLFDGFEQHLEYYFKLPNGQTVHKTVTFFLGTTNTTLVALSAEHQGFDWLPFELAQSRLTYANAREVLQKAEEFVKNKLR